MNRLSPLIVRRAGALAPQPDFDAADGAEGLGGTSLLDDLKLFAVGWVGGLVFFGTFLG